MQNYKKKLNTNGISGMNLLLSFLLVKSAIAANPADDLKIQIHNTKIQNTKCKMQKYKKKYKYSFRDESPAVFPPRGGINPVDNLKIQIHNTKIQNTKYRNTKS